MAGVSLQVQGVFAFNQTGRRPCDGFSLLCAAAGPLLVKPPLTLLCLRTDGGVGEARTDYAGREGWVVGGPSRGTCVVAVDEGPGSYAISIAKMKCGCSSIRVLSVATCWPSPGAGPPVSRRLARDFFIRPLGLELAR